jgi:hypothetical protein
MWQIPNSRLSSYASDIASRAASSYTAPRRIWSHNFGPNMYDWRSVGGIVGIDRESYATITSSTDDASLQPSSTLTSDATSTSTSTSWPLTLIDKEDTTVSCDNSLITSDRYVLFMHACCFCCLLSLTFFARMIEVT